MLLQTQEQVLPQTQAQALPNTQGTDAAAESGTGATSDSPLKQDIMRGIHLDNSLHAGAVNPFYLFFLHIS